MKIEKTMRLSYLHLTRRTIHELWIYDEREDDDVALGVFAHGDFYEVVVSTKHFRNPENLAALDVPEDLRVCVEFAIANDCDWICFTPHESATTELPIPESNKLFMIRGHQFEKKTPKSPVEI